MNTANLVNNYYSAKYFVHYLSLFIKNEQAIKSEQSPLIAILHRIARLIKNDARSHSPLHRKASHGRKSLIGSLMRIGKLVK